MSQPSHQTLPVYPAADLRVVAGANHGDALSVADLLQLEDVYHLAASARTAPLGAGFGGQPPFTITTRSALGQAGAALYIDALLTFMTGTGGTIELLTLAEVTDTGHLAALYALPFGAISPGIDYALIGIDKAPGTQKLAQIASASFTRGTHVTMATGAQVPVESLQPGDRVLTRDNGPQPLRWVGVTTTRAAGPFAPVRICAGALNNDRDLVVSADHRLFVYQRSDALGAGRAEVLVRAGHLVNGSTVRKEPGGHVDYVQLLFDSHQIIYAEGIATESTLLSTANRALISDEAGLDIDGMLPRHRRSDPASLEVTGRLAQHTDTAEALRRASLR